MEEERRAAEAEKARERKREREREEKQESEPEMAQKQTQPAARRGGSETVRVYVRVRPILKMDCAVSVLPRLIVDDPQHLVLPNDRNESKPYKFDAVFGDACSTKDVYDHVCKGPVSRTMNGYSATILAYGQTGSGKTHTMAGGNTEDGIIKLSVHQIFQEIRSKPKMHFEISLSIMEIYNEKLYDLPGRELVEMKSTGDGTLIFAGAAEHPVKTQADVDALVNDGMRGKITGPNYIHAHSSRSHTVVRLIVESTRKSKGQEEVLTGSLMLIDLAGSETVHDNIGQKARDEGTAICKSLFHLRNCVKNLVEGIPPSYRSSNLTRMLEPSIKNGCVSLICSVPLVTHNMNQVRETLLFGQDCKRVELHPEQKRQREKATLPAALEKLHAEQASTVAELDRLRSELERMESEKQSVEEDKAKALADVSEVVQSEHAQALAHSESVADLESEVSAARAEYVKSMADADAE
eukprot:COSAG06_NODE_9347_length_1924_cov_1.796712_1_plen_466_part_10